MLFDFVAQCFPIQMQWFLAQVIQIAFVSIDRQNTCA